MSKESLKPREESEPKVLTEDQVASLLAQFRYMLLHEVKNMKLEVVETIGGMLARRSGVDRELHEITGHMDLLSKAVEGFGGRLSELEKAQGEAPRKGGPLGSARNLGKGTARVRSRLRRRRSPQGKENSEK